MSLRALVPLALLLATHASAGVIEGVAVASNGPVADVEVHATHEGRTVTRRTDAHGHFELPGLSEAGWTLTASRGAEQGELEVYVGTGDTRGVVLELGPPRSVRGIIRGASGTPLQGVRVEAGLQGEYGPLHAREARTGSDGQFEIPVPGFSPIGVRVRAPGHRTRYVASAPANEKLDLVLERSEVLRGVVKDSQGTPVPGVRVRLKRYGRDAYPTSCTGPDPQSALTDERGAFTLEGLGQGRYAFVLLPRAHARLSGDVELPTGEVLWTLPVGIQATVAVTGPDGAPLSASVTLTGPLGDPAFIASDRAARTDTTGSATIAGLVPGDYDVEASLQSGAETRSVRRKVSISGAREPIALAFPGPHRLQGHVTGAGGRPVQVTLEREGGFSVKREGVTASFAFDHLPEGELTLEAWAPDHEEATLLLRLPSSAPARLVLTRYPSHRVTGRVLDTKGRPVRAFQVNSTGVSHAGGRFSVRVTPHEDTATLEVSAPGFASQLLTAGPRQWALGDLRLTPGRTLTGRVETPDGRGLAGAAVWCRWPRLPKGSHAAACHGRTLPDGSLYLAHVPDEPFLLELQHPGWPRTRHLVPAGVSEARVRLSPGLTLQGTVRDGRGRPLEDGRVHVTQDGEWHFAPIHPDGTYTLRVPPGRGTLEVLNVKTGPATFEGTEGQTVRVDLVAPGRD